MKLPGWKVMIAGWLVVFAGCNEAPTEIVGAEMELQQARALWEARGGDDYSMRVRLTGAWFGGAADIWVRDGVPVWVRPAEPNEGLSAEMWKDYDTVDEMFAMLQRAQDEADRVVAEYHPRLGIPVHAGIDWMENAVDDESGFILESFELR